MRFPGFIGPSYQLRSVNVDCQRCVNLYPEFDEMGTAKEKSIGSLIGTPGLSVPLLTLPTSPYRGSFRSSNGTYYIVSGNTLYKVSSAYIATVVGTLLTSAGPVSMADNGIDLCLVDGANGFFSVLGSTTLTQIVSANYLGAATRVTYQDGRFIFNIPGTNQFFVNDTLARTFSGAFDAKSTQPDRLVTVFSDHRNLWLFGEETIEVWFDAGNPPPATPFSLIQGGFIETGLAAEYSIQKFNNTMLFVGREPSGNGIVYSIQGFQPQRISNHAVETVIQNAGDISGTTSWCYQQNGHNFYCLNFKNSSGDSVVNSTWCFDMTTGLWHERAYLSNGVLQRSLIEGHDYVFNQHIVGDYASGNIYKLDLDTYTDNGAAIQRMRVFPHVNADMKRIFYPGLQLDLESGVGLDGGGQGVDPQAMLQFSDDGGNKWSNERWAAMGAIGKKRHRVIWRRLGQARDKVFKVVITDPIKVVLIGAELLAMAGAK